MTLRKSQVETLERIERHGSLSPYELSCLDPRPIHASREHLSGLAYEGFLTAHKGRTGYSYVLTQAGKQALEDSR